MEIKKRYFEIKDELKKIHSDSLSQKIKRSNQKTVNQKEVTEPQIIAVSKTFPAQDIELVFGLGQQKFAENYVNEFVEKFNQLAHLPISWHFIGHLQTNKVDKIVGKAEMIQSVDSDRLLKKIIDVAQKKSIVQKVLIQVKFGEEETKFGFDMKSLDLLFQTYKKEPSIALCGLMCILPLDASDSEKINYFSELREKLYELKSVHNLSDEFKELSMGMSGDFKLAILEGSTMIRIGSAIFGARI